MKKYKAARCRLIFLANAYTTRERSDNKTCWI
jgi:hypothetical protein